MKQRWLPEFDYPDVEQPREEADSTATEAVSAGVPNLGRLMCDGGLSRLTERYTAAKIVCLGTRALLTSMRSGPATGFAGDLAMPLL
jgi:hypothetical protein